MVKIAKKIRDILFGSDDEEIKFSYDDGYEKYSHKKTFEGVVNNLERRYLETDKIGKEKKYLNISQILNVKDAMDIDLKMKLCVKINKLNISEVTDKSIHEAKIGLNHLKLA